MSVRSHILLMLTATIVAWISWLLVITNINPQKASWWGFALFYFSLFLSLFGSFAFLGFVTRTLAQFRRRTLQYKASTALRQGFLWALALICALALQGQRLLTWWIFAGIVIFFALVEFFAITLQQKSARHHG